MTDPGQTDDMAKHIEREVIDDMYKTTREKLQARREQYRSLANGYDNAGSQKTDQYRRYLDELKKEYRSEKEEKVRNKSFEYDKSFRSNSEAHLVPASTMTNILSSIKDDDGRRREVERSARDNETVLVRNEIRSRLNAGPRDEADDLNSANNVFGEYAIAKENLASERSRAHDRPRNGSRDEPRAAINMEGSEALGYGSRSGQNKVKVDHENWSDANNFTRTYNRNPEIHLEDANHARGDAIYHEDAFHEYGTGIKQKVNHRDEKSDNTKVQFVNQECQDTRELLKDRFGENDNHNYPGLPSTPTRGISGLHLSSSEKRLYNWQEEKASDDCFKLPRGKSRDPFEEKDTQAFDKSIIDSYLKPVNSRPPLHSRSPPREVLPASFNDKSKLDIKDGYQDKMYFTERDHRKEYRSKDSDLGHQSTSREHDFATLMGKCKRLESENQILLKNNSELRKENLEMREKLAHSEPMKELENKIRELNEINKKLELQLMSQASSPVLASNSSYHQSRPFFNQNSLSRERLNRSGGSSDRPHKHFESSKHFSQTERLNGANSKAMSTKVKFADSVLGMLRQLVDLNKGDEEFKQAWKLLKNVIGEYVELKREARSGPRSPLLKKDLSTNSENFRMKSPDVVRQRSAERNKWRDRNKAAELGF